MATVQKSSDIKNLRERLGMTQVEFARLLGVAPNTVARWERGELGLSHSSLKLFSVLKGWSSPSELKKRLRAASKK
jgi:DNA-binding transcriptional regulator YiaG